MKKLSQLIRSFLKWAEKCLTKSSVAVYRHYFRKFIEHHGDKQIARLRPSHLTEWAYTWHAAQAMKRLFNWAVNESQCLKKNPFVNVVHPPKGERKRIMGRKEMIRFLRASALDLRCLLTGHRETFARPLELRAAKWTDIVAEDRSLTTREALTSGVACIVLYDYKQRKKRRLPGAPRVILLSPRACKLLLRLLSRTPDETGVIFRTKRGKAWTPNAVRCRLRRLRRRLGLKVDERGENIVPYTFRHTGATLCSAKGIRDRLLADILGHVETSTTARYQHLSLDHLRAALKPLWFPEAKK